MKKLIFIALFVASFCSSFARTKSTSKAKFVAGNLTQIRICTYAVNFAALAAAQGQDTFAIYNNCNTAGGFVLANQGDIEALLFRDERRAGNLQDDIDRSLLKDQKTLRRERYFDDLKIQAVLLKNPRLGGKDDVGHRP